MSYLAYSLLLQQAQYRPVANPNGTIDSNGNESAPQSNSDDRPTLKRRDPDNP